MIIGSVGWWVGDRLVVGSVSKWSVVGWSVVGGFNKTRKKNAPTEVLSSSKKFIYKGKCGIVTK